MFDNLKFKVVDSFGNGDRTEFTLFGLISILYKCNFLTFENAYSFFVFLANAKPNDEYITDKFTVTALPY